MSTEQQPLPPMDQLQFLHDCELECEDGQIIPCYKVILAVASPFLKALFMHNQHRKQFKVDAPCETVQQIVDYIMTKRISFKSCSEANAVLKVADRWIMEPLLLETDKYIFDHLNVNNAVGIWFLAILHSRIELEKKVRRYVLQHFERLMNEASEDILELNAESLKILLDDEWLNLESEDRIYDITKKWIALDPSNRTDSRDFLNGAFRAERKRRPHQSVLAVGGWNTGSPTKTMEAYDHKADRWVTCESVGAEPRAYHGISVIGSDVYMVGGFDGTDYYNSVTKWNVAEDTWTTMNPMYVPRCYVSVTVLDRAIYAIGGFDGRNRLNSAERYDVERNQWSLIERMHHSRSDADAVAFNGRIYVVGGFDGRNPLDSVECYDPQTNTWTLVASMNSPRSGVSACVTSEFILVFGGFNGSTRLGSGEAYDLETSEWHLLADMGGPRSNFALVTLDNRRIYAIGGYNGTETILTLEEYDVEENKWTVKSGMRLDRSAVKACLIETIDLDHIKQTANFEIYSSPQQH